MTDNYPFLPLQPEAHKLNADEHSKMCKCLHNYIIMLRKFMDPSKKTGWSQSFNFLQKLYAKSNNPMPITPLALHMKMDVMTLQGHHQELNLLLHTEN
jgi:hypothetical protein